MKLKAKKQIGGKNVILVDSEGADISEVVNAMLDDGWTFTILQASYTSKSGEKKKKDFTQYIDKISAIQRKYNLDNWTFKASKGTKTIGAQMNNSKHTVAIQQSKGGAWEDFCALMIVSDDILSTPFPKPQQTQPRNMPRSKSRRIMPTPQQQPLQQGEFAQMRQADEEQIAAALYDDTTDTIPEITPMQKEARRAAVRKQDNIKSSNVKVKKHTLLLVLSILELFSPGIAFGVLSLKDTLTGRKLSTSDPGEAERRFKEAKILLIFGFIAAIAGIVAFNLPALLR